MGFFSSGPSIRSRMRSGREEWYGNCPGCGKEKAATDKGRVARQLKDCEAQHEKVKREAEKKARKRAEEAKRQEQHDRAESARAKAAAKEQAEAEKRAKAADKLRNDMLKTARQKRREAKGKRCPWCRQQPCAGTRAQCAKVKAQELESAHNIDMSDPATFDAQLRWYKNNM